VFLATDIVRLKCLLVFFVSDIAVVGILVEDIL